METTTLNKAIVLDFWKRAIGQRDLSVAQNLVSENYIQHSAAGKPGKAGLMEALALLKQMPKPENQSKPTMQVIADGDYVVVHMLIEFNGQHMIVVDLVRLEQGLLMEHWDAVEPVFFQNNCDEEYIADAATQISDEHLTEVNKNTIADFHATLSATKDPDKVHEFVVDNILLHPPAFKNGIDGMKDRLRSYKRDKLHRIIGEGNLVVTQTTGSITHLPSVIYDIYKLRNGKIVECWGAKQTIPKRMEHSNGMV